ncbi:purine nucleotide binding protein [Pyrrhoderma noxium]|uniref:Purine nucleotide binding protein n=1 Tax=Pyrrhoderma noxium TaxID=2282107 RepID=A0A286U994_9AGAM|nr:purine nucleotide binding protein [Pyrrhoderma noxium]
MSFSGTPLGQDRRLDHQAFFKGGPATSYGSHARAPINHLPVPKSFAYGAPTNATASIVSTSPPRRSQPGNRQQDEEEEELSRYNQLKQRNQALANRPVNIASAFQQAATSYTMAPNSGSWNNRPNMPRSTSVEYEQQSQTATHRRLAVPPRRVNGNKPPSRSGTVIQETDNENDRSTEYNTSRERGKSPFEQLADITQRAVQSSATFLMRQRSQEPENHSFSRPTDTSFVGQGQTNGGSYSYEAEEEEYQESQRSKKSATVPKRNKISEDNRAYQPTITDEESTDEESGADRRGRRRKKKKDVGPTANFPTLQYDKRRRKKARSGKQLDEDTSIEVEEQEQMREQNQRRPSVSRGSAPPSRGGSAPPDTSRSFNTSGPTDTSGDLGGLDSIPEVDESYSQQAEAHESMRSSTKPSTRPRSRSRSRIRKAKSSSSGARLGSLVFVLYNTILRNLGRLVGLTLRLLLVEPVLFVRKRPAFSRLALCLAISAGLYIVFLGLRNQDIITWSSTSSNRVPYKAPELPPESVDEFTSRLVKLENMLAGLQAESISERDRIDTGLRRAHEIAKHIDQLENREVRALQNQQKEQASRMPKGPVNDEEARAKLTALEERLGSMEGNIKQALELGQQVSKASPVAAGASHWWNKVASGKMSGITIKASDGSDVTPIINALVEQALNTYGLRGTYFFGLLSDYTYARSPVTALHHELTIGYCWPFSGPQGHLGVKLSVPVRVTDITIDHVAREVALDNRPAPRNFEVWGFVEGEENLEKLRLYRESKEAERQLAREEGREVIEDPVYPDLLQKDKEYLRLGTFTYDVHEPQNVQTFSVDDEIKDTGIDVGIVVLFINSNWGHPDYTCLYRFRVHGERPFTLPDPDPQELEP